MGDAEVGGGGDLGRRAVGGAQAREVGAVDESSQFVEHRVGKLELAPAPTVLGDGRAAVGLDDEPGLAPGDRPAPEEVDERSAVRRRRVRRQWAGPCAAEDARQ